MNLGFDLKDWEEVEAVEMGDFETLELGGHEVVIMDARLYTSEQSGNTSLKVCVDIAGNDKQKGFFKKQYDNNNLSERKWPSGGTRYLSLKKESLQFTKGFVSALEKSNNDFKFDTNKGWEQLNGLKCAGQFGWEEYQDNEGNTKLATKLVQFRSLDKLKEIKIPKVKLLDGTMVDYEDYNQFYRNKNNNTTNNVVEISAENLPF
jgi:hypothetical protein